MSERFTEAEAQRIFARAAERQRHDADHPADGLTLAELQEIGAAAGLDPADIAAAVAEGRRQPEAPAPTFLGVPLTVRRERVLPGPVTDAAWVQAVAEIRQTVGRVGTASQIGPLREWTVPSPNGGGLVRIVLEPTAEGGTHVTAEAGDPRAPASFRWLAGFALAFTALMALVVPFEIAEDPTIWGLPVAFAGLFALVIGLALWGRRAALRNHSRQFDGFLDRLDRLARDATGPLAEPATSAGPDAEHIDASRLDASRLDASRLDNGVAPLADRAASGRVDLDGLDAPDAEPAARTTRRDRA